MVSKGGDDVTQQEWFALAAAIFSAVAAWFSQRTGAKVAAHIKAVNTLIKK